MNQNRWIWQTSGLLVLVLIELLYIGVTRYLLGSFEDANAINLEAIRTIVRILSAALTLWLFKDVVLFSTRKTSNTSNALTWKVALPCLAVLLFFSIPVIQGNWNLPKDGTRIVFALASFPVGLREELVYRAVLITLIAKRFGFIWGLIVSTVAFTFYHYGALPWTTFNIIQYVAAGIILGLLFWTTKSLWLVIWIHTIYDVIWCYTPLLPSPMSQSTGLFMLCLSTSLIILWTCLGHRKDTALK